MMRRYVRPGVLAAPIALVAACAAAVAGTAAPATAAVSRPAAAAPAWRITTVLPNAAIDGLTALSPRNAWAPVRFNSLVEAAVAPTPTTLWVFGSTPLPSLGIRGGGPLNALWIQGIAAISPRDAWADVGILGDVGKTYLVHWNGKKWTRAPFPYTGFVQTPVAPDGHGGIWLAIDAGPAPQTSLWFCHYANGRWTKTFVPEYAGQQPTVDNVAWIPGTRSLWAAGGLDISGSEAILTYGP